MPGQSRLTPFCHFYSTGQLTRAGLPSILILFRSPRFTLKLVHEALDFALHQAAEIMEAYTCEGSVDTRFVAKVAYLKHHQLHVQRSAGRHTFVDAADSKLVFKISIEAYAAARGGNFEQSTAQRAAAPELIAVQ